MRGTGALARASMADLKPDRVRAAELAQTGAGRGRARGEKIEREHESTRTLFEHLNPSELAVVPSGMRPKNFVGIESLVSVGVGSSERESDDSVSVDTNASHSTDLSLETAHLPAGSKDMGNGWIWGASIQRFMKKERTMKKEERVAKWVQTATGAWEQAAPKRLPVEPDFDEMQTGITGGRKKKKKKKSGAAKRRQRKGRVDSTTPRSAMQVATTMAEKARMAAEKVLDWSQRFPTKVAGWAARRAAWGAAAAAKEEAQFAEEEARWAAFKGREWALTLTLKIEKILHTGLTRRRRGRRGVGSGRRRRRRVGRERQRGRQEQMRRAWEREGWRRAELQWVQRQDARWRSKGGKGVSWRLRQRKQRRRRLATANNAMRRLPARGIGPGTGRQGPLQRGVGGASRRQWQKRLRAGKGGAGASGQQQRRLGGGGKRGWVT